MIYVKKPPFDAIEYFTRKEADEKGIQYIYWREATGAKQWVITDDHFVLETTEVRYITETVGKYSRTRRKVKTGLGIYYPHGKMQFLLAKNLKLKRFARIPLLWCEEKSRCYPRLIPRLSEAVLTGKLHMNYWYRYTRSEYSEMIAIAKEIFPAKYHWDWYHVRRFFNHDWVRMQIRKEIEMMAKKKGIDVEKVFDLLIEAETNGRQKKDGKVLLAVAKEYAGIVGMNLRLSDGNGHRQLPATDGEDLPGSNVLFDDIIDGDYKTKVTTTDAEVETTNTE